MSSKRPIVVGKAVNKNAKINEYATGIAQRQAAVNAAKPKLGNLAEANASYSPGRDGPATLGQIFNSQVAVAATDAASTGFKPGTIEALKAVKAATDAAYAAKQTKKEPVVEEKPKTEPVPAETKFDSKAEREKTAAAIDNMDEFELDRIMRGIQNDVINNVKERDHVNDPKNGRLSEINFADGIALGEFRQTVDVIPGKMKVHYRTVSGMENKSIRLWVFKQITLDPTLDRLASEMFGLGLVAASVVQLNSTQYVDHLVRPGTGTYGATFNEDAFALKYKQFESMPQPLLHALGTHGQWFDIRIRTLFTMDFAKNG